MKNETKLGKKVDMKSWYKGHIDKAIMHLCMGFDWETTEEGHKYWVGVINKLHDMRNALIDAEHKVIDDEVV